MGVASILTPHLNITIVGSTTTNSTVGCDFVSVGYFQLYFSRFMVMKSKFLFAICASANDPDTLEFLEHGNILIRG